MSGGAPGGSVTCASELSLSCTPASTPSTTPGPTVHRYPTRGVAYVVLTATDPSKFPKVVDCVTEDLNDCRPSPDPTTQFPAKGKTRTSASPGTGAVAAGGAESTRTASSRLSSARAAKESSRIARSIFFILQLRTAPDGGRKGRC